MNTNEYELTSFKYENTQIDVALGAYFNKEWLDVLRPLFSTEYFAGLMCYMRHFYLENPNHSKNLSPRARADVFKPFAYIKPEDVRCVLLLDAPSDRSITNGVGFGGGTVHSNTTLNLHNRYFSKEFKEPQITDPSLVSWLKQGVLVLNQRTMVHSDLPYLHDKAFNYFYKNVISYLAEKNEDFIIATVCKRGEKFIDSLNLSNNTVCLKSNGYFPSDGMSVYNKINTQFMIYGEPGIRWSSAE